MNARSNKLTSLEDFKENNYGKLGTKKRDEIETGYEIFKMGVIIHDKRIE